MKEPVLSRAGLAMPPLPQPLTRLIGREQQAREIVALFDGGARLVTLTGPGGIGKTRLAIDVAHRLADAGRTRVAFVSLELVSQPTDVVAAIRRTIGVADRAGETATEAIRASVADGPLVLVLDNLDHVLAVRGQLVDLVTSVPELALLVTSRSLLRVAGEYRFVVPPLGSDTPSAGSWDDSEAWPAAARLFFERATAVAPDWEIGPTSPAAIGRICRYLEGWPLAIELAAARVSHLSLEELERWLTDRFAILSSPYPTDNPRHRALRDTIRWSYDLLDQDQQRTLRLLSVFRAGFTLQAAIAVVATDPSRGSTATEPGKRDAASPVEDEARVVDALGGLVESSLVTFEAGDVGRMRYRVLDTIRDFASELLVANEEQRFARECQARWFVELVEGLEIHPFAPRVTDGMKTLGAEVKNEQAALEWLREIGDRQSFARLAAATAYAWWLRGTWRTDRILLGQVWDDGPSRIGLPVPARVRVGIALGLMHAAQEQGPERAVAILETCVTDSRAAGETISLVTSLIAQGWSLAKHDQPTASLPLFLEALALTRSMPASAYVSSLLGVVLNNLAAAHRWIGEYEIANRYLDDASDVLQTSGNQTALRYNTIDRAALSRDAADYRQAWTLFRHALACQEMWRDHRYLVGCLDGMATVASATGQWLIAARLLGSLERVSQLSGLPALSTHDGRIRETAIQSVRSNLGEDAWNAARTAGFELSLDEIIHIDLNEGAVAIEDRTAGMVRTGGRPGTADVVGTGPAAGITLTRREHDVLRSLAAGRSNREIADELFVSPRTVESHLSRLFDKLGVTSRTAAVAAALRHGIETDSGTGTT